MTQEDYSDYYINDLIRDLTEDYRYVRKKIDQFLKLKKWFENFSIVWGYITCVLFIIYGIRRLVTSGDVLFPIIIFSISAVYAVVTTVLLVMMRNNSKEEVKLKKRDIARTRKIFKYVSYIIKTTIIIITFISINTADYDTTRLIVLNILSMVWMVISVVVDLLVFFVNRALALLKEFCLREIERTKAAVKNTVKAPVKFGGEALSKAGNFFKGLFSFGKNDHRDEDVEEDPFDE